VVSSPGLREHRRQRYDSAGWTTTESRDAQRRNRGLHRDQLDPSGEPVRPWSRRDRQRASTDLYVIASVHAPGRGRQVDIVVVELRVQGGSERCYSRYTTPCEAPGVVGSSLPGHASSRGQFWLSTIRRRRRFCTRHVKEKYLVRRRS